MVGSGESVGGVVSDTVGKMSCKYWRRCMRGNACKSGLEKVKSSVSFERPLSVCGLHLSIEVVVNIVQ